MLIKNFIKIIIYKVLISSIVADNYFDNIRPLNYKINLTPNIQDENNLTFNGKVHTDIEIKASMNNSFVLHSKSLEIKDDIALINSTSKFYSRNFLIDEKQNLLFIRFNKTLTKGNYTLEITYLGLISKNKSESFIYVTYRDHFKGKRWLLLTNIESDQDVSKIFPCLLEENPTKVTLELSVQHNRGFTVLSNTQYNSIIASSESFKNVWTNFDKTPLLLTRQLNLIIGNLECSTYYDEEYRVWTLKNVENNHNNLSIVGGKVWNAMKNITGIIDDDSVIKKFDFVLLHGIDLPPIDPFFSYGIIVTNSEKFSYVENHSNFTSINQFAQQIAFSICMQWYPLYIFHSNTGNEYFLQYGLINYLILATTDQTNEPEHAMDKIIYQVNDSNNRLMKLIKAMHVIGKAHFLNLLHELTLKRYYCYSKLSYSGDLEKNYLVNKYSEVLNVDVVTFMEFLGNQILTNGYPVVTVTRNYTASNAAVTQNRFSKFLAENFSEKYWIPLNCENERSPNFEDTSINWWLSPDSNKIEIPVAAASTSWIICNNQLIGNYRVNYDDKNWKLIMDYLKSSNYHKIHPINRAQIIDDVLTFAEFGYVNHSLVFELTEYLQYETHRIPLAKFMDYFFNIHDSWLFKISDYHKEFEKHHLSREKKKIERIFCNGIREADQKSWDRLFKVYHIYRQIEILKALGCSSNRVILYKYMMLVLRSNWDESNYLILFMFRTIAEKSNIGIDTILDFLIHLQQKKHLSWKEKTFIIKATAIVNHYIINDSQLDKLQNILDKGKPYFGILKMENFHRIAVNNIFLSSFKPLKKLNEKKHIELNKNLSKKSF